MHSHTAGAFWLLNFQDSEDCVPLCLFLLIFLILPSLVCKANHLGGSAFLQSFFRLWVCEQALAGIPLGFGIFVGDKIFCNFMQFQIHYYSRVTCTHLPSYICAIHYSTCCMFSVAATVLLFFNINWLCYIITYIYMYMCMLILYIDHAANRGEAGVVDTHWHAQGGGGVGQGAANRSEKYVICCVFV